jgi:hypothetical protein
MLHFKNLLLATLAIVFLLAGNIYTQDNNGTEKYSQVRISMASEDNFNKLGNAGLFLDGGMYKKGLYFETWLSETEISMLKNSGVPYEITVDDWMSYYTEMQRKNYVSPSIVANDAYTINHSIYGTMGGHLKWTEALAKLDSMRLQYPTLVSVKFSYGNSYEGRPLWTVRITKNPDAPTGRPELWLNGVTHAREPLGMENVFYYVYWLLENYNIDPVATYILNNREIYFTPFINPDGYVYNETTNPNGGGQWRKNRQPYGGSTGTDCNRNFGTYNFWNSTNGGSSTTPSSDTYRGPYPFSTPEDSCFKVFFNSRNFKVALDYHTYGNYLIKPYGWCDPTPTPDDAIFNEMGADIIADNHFSFGTPYQTVNYYVRGGDIDWCYSSDSTGHGHRFVMTPEVGTTGFWPTQAEIIPLAQTCMYQNIYISLVAGPYAGLKTATFNKTTYVQNETGNCKVVIRNKGLMDAQNVKIMFTPVSSTSYISIPTQVYTKATLPSRTSDSTTFNFTIGAACPNNTAITVRLRVLQNDTIALYDQNYSLFVGTGYSILRDSAENGTTNFPTMTNWSIVTNKYLSPTHSFKGTCIANNVSQMITVPLNVQAYPAVYLSFYQKYALETGYDYGFLDVSSNNGSTWRRLATFNGVDSSSWKFQSYNLTPYVSGSTNMLIRFRDSCDGSQQWDGWYVDNINVTGFQPAPTGISGNINTVPEKFALLQNYPNPFNPVTQINYSIAKEGLVKITIFDLLGREVKTLINEYKSPGYYAVDFDGTSLSSGMYFYRMESGNFNDVKKMILIK